MHFKARTVGGGDKEMEKKYLALLVAVAVIGAIAFVPANVAGVDAVEEDDKIEISLSDLMPNIYFELGDIGYSHQL